MNNPAVYYNQIDEVFSGFWHEIQVMQNDLDNFQAKYDGKTDIPDSIRFAINSRKQRLEKLRYSYKFIAEYTAAMYEEMNRVQGEKRELEYKMKYESESLEEIRAKARAAQHPAISLNQAIHNWLRSLEPTIQQNSNQIIPANLIKEALQIQKENAAKESYTT